MTVPIPIPELDKYTTHELEIYIAEHERRETVQQVELISKDAEFTDKVKSDINSCICKEDFIRLLDKYAEIDSNKYFKKDVITRLDEILISKAESEAQLVSIWNIFKPLAVVEDPEDLLITAIKKRRTELNNK